MKLKIISILLLCITSLSLSAQGSRKITGKVWDNSDRSTMVGATVIIKGTVKGTTTDIDGNFTLTLEGPDPGSIILEVSFVGYQPQTVQVKDLDYFEFYLDPEVNSLDEVIVTSSYGTRKLKQEVVGSISSIRTKDLVVEQSAVSFDELLEGQTAGVYIEQGSEVGKPVNIHVRGQGSLTPLSGNNVGTSTQPLIIVDGIILSEEITLDGNSFFDAGSGKYSEDLLNPLAKVGIKDIESINVLKDAAAVSLYGADGANGVIVITTKSGEKGPIKYTFSAQGGISAATNGMLYMTGEQFQEMRNLYYINSGQAENAQEWNGVNTNWYDLLNRTGSFQNYDFSLSGGSDRIKYRVSLDYRNIQEPQIKNNFSKYNSGISVSYETKKLRTSLKVSPSYSIKNTPNTLYSFAVPPTLAPYDSEGNYTKFDTYGNPLAVANQNQALVKTLASLASINASYRFNDNLQVSSMFGIDYSDKNQDTFFSGLNETGIDNSGNLGVRLIRDRYTTRWNWNANATYNRDFREFHHVDIMAGVETRQNSVVFSYSRGENFTDPGKIQPISEATIQDYEQDRSENTGRSLFSQLNYDFRKKYFLLFNFRIDQSSVFGTDNNTSYNGGFGASWVISNEPFFDNIKIINFMRMRVSYGTSGNSRIGSYRALGLYTFDDIGGDGYNRGNYANPYSAPNPNLGWEKNYKFNLGFDVTTGTNISASIEFFNDNIRDMIVSRDVIPESGYTSVQINGADMYNRGIEVSLRSPVFSTSKFKWTSLFNFSTITNKVTNLQGLGSDFSSSESARAQRIGYATSLIWGYEFVGIDPATGRELYNIDGNIIDGNLLSDNYRDTKYWKPIGNTQPDIFGGFNNRFSVGKNLDIAVVMSYSFGADILVQKELVDHYRLLTNRNLSINAWYNSWKKPGDIAWYPSISNSNPLISNSTKYLYSTSNIKLRSINISYVVTLKRLEKYIDKAHLYLNASNLYSWYLDRSPEGRNGIREMRNVYPEMRTFTMGLNLSF